MKGDKALVTSVILGGLYDMKKVEEQPEGRFLRIMNIKKVEYFHISPSPQMKLKGGKLLAIQDGHLKVRERQTQSYLGEHTLVKGTKNSSKELNIPMFEPK